MYFVFEDVKVNYKIYLNKASNLPPVIFLHGWGGEIASFDFFASKLILMRTCILVDFPPFGKSSEPKQAWDVKKYAKMIEYLLDHLGYNICDIVAHSFGGRIAIELATSSSIKIRKMLLTASAGIKKKSIKRNFKIAIFKIKKFLSKIHLYSKASLDKQGSFDYKSLSKTMKMTFSKVVSYDQTKCLKNIKCPTLLFWGERDKDTPFYFTKIFKKHINNCGIIKVDGSHFAYIEYSRLFLSVLVSFLKE